MTTKTPEQIADDVLRPKIGDPTTTHYGISLRESIVAAIEADRAQPAHDGTVHAAVIQALKERENQSAAEYVENNPDHFWDRFAGPMLDDIEQSARHECDYCGEPATGEHEGDKVCDQHAPVVIPEEDQCDECEEEATNRWPNLKEPVQLCDSCTHNARRSGWEPGQ